MRRQLVIATLALVVLAGVAGSAAAQYRRRGHYHGGGGEVVFIPYGLYVGAAVEGTRILDQSGDGDELLGHGGGLTLFSGIRLNPIIALELGWLISFHNPARVATIFGDDVDYLVLNGFTGDAKIYLGNLQRGGEMGTGIEPYLQGGLGLYLLDSTYFGTQSIGTGFQLGGGLDFALAPRVAVTLRVLYRGMAMGPPERAENDTFVSALTGELGLQFGF
jgi:hypothetical protein